MIQHPVIIPPPGRPPSIREYLGVLRCTLIRRRVPAKRPVLEFRCPGSAGKGDLTEDPGKHMTAADATTLYDIRRIWEDRYKIDFMDGVWQACRLVGGISILTADTPDQLRGQIREDYRAWQDAARRQS
jgi:hypothetical protein